MGLQCVMQILTDSAAAGGCAADVAMWLLPRQTIPTRVYTRPVALIRGKICTWPACLFPTVDMQAGSGCTLGRTGGRCPHPSLPGWPKLRGPSRQRTMVSLQAVPVRCFSISAAALAEPCRGLHLATGKLKTNHVLVRRRMRSLSELITVAHFPSGVAQLSSWFILGPAAVTLSEGGLC